MINFLFINNKNILLSIEYLIYFININNKANIINLSLIKYKWVIYNILIIELYKIIYEFDIKAIIIKMLEKIFQSIILLILYINLKFFYNCLVK